MHTPKLSRRTGAVLAAVVASAIAVPLGFTSSHREAPNIMLDPSADNTDVYAFTAPKAEDAITIARRSRSNRGRPALPSTSA